MITITAPLYSVAWLEQTLAEYRGAVIVITHDRFFLDRVVDWMLEIFHARAIPYKGNYSAYLEQKGRNMEQADSSERKRAKFLERETDALAEWFAAVTLLWEQIEKES